MLNKLVVNTKQDTIYIKHREYTSIIKGYK
jgi:hypothetical protein